MIERTNVRGCRNNLLGTSCIKRTSKNFRENHVEVCVSIIKPCTITRGDENFQLKLHVRALWQGIFEKVAATMFYTLDVAFPVWLKHPSSNIRNFIWRTPVSLMSRETH